jgi:peptide chain release factor subunit 1
MNQFNILKKLLDVQPNGSSFISIYLKTEPNETGKKDFDVFLKKQLSDHLAVLDAGSEERERFEKDAEKISEFAETIDASTRGAAIFASAGNDDFFQTFEFEVPFAENEFHVYQKPHIFPLALLIDRNPAFAVVSADTNSANISVLKRAKTIRSEEIQNTKTNRSEVGGWSQMRYQRHIDNFHQQHAKEVIDELEKIVRADRIEHIVLAGDQAVIIPLLRGEMSEELSKKVVDSLALNVNTSDHDLAEAAREALAKRLEETDKEKMEYLSEVNYDDGVGITGVDKTLAALFNGQVQELYLSANPENVTYNVNDVRLVLKQYEPGFDEDLPDPREKENLIDELIKLAAASADAVRFINDEHLLKTAGGVGAILRYKAEGVAGS